MKNPDAVTWLGQIDEVWYSELYHLYYLYLIPYVDPLQQSVDLADLKAALCHPADHCGVTRITCSGRIMVTQRDSDTQRQEGAIESLFFFNNQISKQSVIIPPTKFTQHNCAKH